jgi:hypothetical protein
MRNGKKQMRMMMKKTRENDGNLGIERVSATAELPRSSAQNGEEDENEGGGGGGGEEEEEGKTKVRTKLRTECREERWRR